MELNILNMDKRMELSGYRIVKNYEQDEIDEEILNDLK